MAEEKKFNLKNRPSWNQLGGASGKDFEDWFESLKKELQEKSKMGMDNKLWIKYFDVMWELWERAPERFKWSHTGDKFRGFAMGYIMAQVEMLGE